MSSDDILFDDEWVTTIYENCAVAVEGLQAKDKLTTEEQGLQNLCEVVVYLYDELYESPIYTRYESKDSRVLH